MIANTTTTQRKATHPVPTKKRSNLERFTTLQDLVKKKTQLKLELTDFEKPLLIKTWGQKTQNNPHDEKSISFMLSCATFWDSVYQLIHIRVPKLDLESIKPLVSALPGMIQMAIMNIDDLNRMDDYLANLGRCQTRLWGVDSFQIYQLGAALIDTVVDSNDGSQIDHFYEIVSVWCKLYCFFANSMIQAASNDPILLLNPDDPFQLPTVDVDKIIQEHFPSTTITTIDNNNMLMGTVTNEDDATTLFDDEDTISIHDTKSLVGVVVHEVSAPDEQQQQQQQQYDDDEDDSDMYDIFKQEDPQQHRHQSRASRIMSMKPVSIKNYAQSQRAPLNDLKNNYKTTTTKKMGFLKRMAVKAIAD